MYVAIRQYGLLTNEPVEDVLRGIREGFIPIIRNAPGFLSYYALDSGSGTLTTIIIFEHRAEDRGFKLRQKPKRTFSFRRGQRSEDGERKLRDLYLTQRVRSFGYRG